MSILTTGSEENAGKTIADIVEDEGWESFRARETATLEAVTAPSTVIATGGGIILAPYNRQFMREKGVVILPLCPGFYAGGAAGGVSGRGTAPGADRETAE